MTNEHPITPPPKLVQEWLGDFFGCTVSGELSDSERYLATCAARWGADQELEACCEWVEEVIPSWAPHTLNEQLRAARRPKPPSLKELALEMLSTIERDARYLPETTNSIRWALESLND